MNGRSLLLHAQRQRTGKIWVAIRIAGGSSTAGTCSPASTRACSGIRASLSSYYSGNHSGLIVILDGTSRRTSSATADCAASPCRAATGTTDLCNRGSSPAENTSQPKVEAIQCTHQIVATATPASLRWRCRR